jgi:uncharacterized protein (DUF1778 family)
MLTLGAPEAMAMTDDEWTAFTASSAMRRARPAILRRNALRLK